MQTKTGTKSRALVFLLSFAMVMSFLVTVGQKDDWRAYAADAANAKYSLAGAEYWVYTNSGCTTRAKDADGNNAVLTTKADGTTNEVELEEGTYYVKEKSASRGYILDSTVYTVSVTADETTWVNGNPGVKETPQSAPFSLQKVDWDTGQATPATGAEFEGAEFEVKYTDGASVTRTWIVRADSNGLVNLDNNHFVSGDTRYKNSQNQFVVPIGTVTVKEVTAPVGYAKSDEVYTINIGWDGANATNETTSNISGSGSKGGAIDLNPIKVKYREKKQSAPFTLQKVDAETGKPVPMGSAEFTNATFEISCTAGEDAGKTWTIKADENGLVDLENATGDTVYKNSAGKAALKLGTYAIKETTAPKGYLKNGGTYTLKIQGDNSGSETTSNVTATDSASKATMTANPLKVTWPENVIRGDIHWNKIKERSNERLDVPFTITSKTTGETHVAFAGEDGTFVSKSSYNAHSNKTNANDVILDSEGNPIVDSNGWVDMSKMDSTAGIWFYTDREGNEAREVDDNLGALPFDTYIVNELRCEANEGYDLVTDMEFEIVRNDWDKDMGTLTDPKEEPKYDFYKVRNEEATSNGAGKFGFQPGDYVTYDVTINNPNSIYKLQLDVSDEFTEGAEYFTKPVVVGVKNAEQKKLSDDKNTVTIVIEPKQEAVVTFGALVKTNAVEYLANAAADSDSKKNDKDCNYTVRDNEPDEADGYRNFAYSTNVKAIPTDGGDQPKDLVEKEDDAQTPVKEPKIGTVLADNAGRKIVSGEKATLVDTVTYEGLTPGKTYVFEGSLIVKDSGDPLVENGEKVTARSDEFVPEEANGTATVTFTVDVKNVMGKELVAFETAFKVKEEDGSKPKDENGDETDEVEVAKHEDPEDEAQTVEVPGYTMHKERVEDASAKGKKFGFSPGEKVTYVVTYTNTSKTALITLTASDDFVEGKDYFTKPLVVKVDGAKESTIADNKETAEIKIEAGQSAVVTFETTIKEAAKEYLANAAKDSDSLDADGNPTHLDNQANKTDDKDGYKNVAKAENPTPENPNPPDPDDPNPEEPYDPLPPSEDPSQTPVKEPEIGTYLADDAKKQDVNPSGSTVLVDTVSYKGLTPGQQYAVVGELMLKDTSDPLVENGTPVTAVGVFTPKSADGSTTVEFVIDTTGLIGKEVVAFETAYNITGKDVPEDPSKEDVEEKGTKVAEHKDIKDKSQTIKVKQPKIGTFLADDAEQKKVDPSGETVLIDTVAYTGLAPGHEYAVVGELILKDTGDPLVENGKKIKAMATFIPEKETGVAEVEFVINTKGLEGKEIVAFETAYSIEGLDNPDNPSIDEVEENGKKVGEHKDLNDKNQIVWVKEPGKKGPWLPKTPNTGDYIKLGAVGVFLSSLLALLVMMIRRRKAATSAK